MSMVTYSEQTLKNLIIYHEYINHSFNLNDYNTSIQEILTLSPKVNIIQNYTYLSPEPYNDNIIYKYKLKLFIKLIYSLEYNDTTIQGDMQYLTLEKPIVLSVPLPETYRDGFQINIIPKILDNSYTILENTISLANFISFYVSL